MKTILALFVIALFATPARAVDTADGNFLLGSCQISLRVMDNPSIRVDVYEAWRDGMCLGLIAGVAEASPLVCYANGVTNGQSLRVVVKFLQDHPEKLNERDTTLIREALAQAFPCSK
jgi:hypothetical protein